MKLYKTILAPVLAILAYLFLGLVILLYNPLGVSAQNTETTVLDNASSQYWSLPDDDDFDNLSAMTISGDFYFTSNNIDELLFSKYDNSNRVGFQLWYYGASGKFLQMYIYEGSSPGTFDAFTYYFTATTSVWTNLRFVWDGSTKNGKFFLNGDQVSDETKSNVDQTGNDTQSLMIGARWDGNTFDGYIDTVRFYNTVNLDFSDMACSPATSTVGLIEEWDFDGNGNGVNGKNLTNNNSATFQSGNLPFASSCGEATTTPSNEGIATGTVQYIDQLTGYVTSFDGSATTTSFYDLHFPIINIFFLGLISTLFFLSLAFLYKLGL